MKRFISYFTYTLGIALVVAQPNSVMAAPVEVTLRNGNLLTSFYDMRYKGGLDPSIIRTYNSKSSYKGMFGWSWSSDFDTFLSTTAEGTVVIHEFGGGSDNRFSPLNFSQKDIAAGVDMIMEAAKKSRIGGSPSQVGAYRQRLIDNATFRDDQWSRYIASGKLKPKEIPIGTQFKSVLFAYQYVTKVKDGYVRNFDTGRTEYYNEAGKIRRIEDKNNNYINLTYGPDGHLQKIIDQSNRKMFFQFNNIGLVSKIEGENSQEATYEYTDLGELKHTKDPAKNEYWFEYDKEGTHDLTKIKYSDKTFYAVEYYGPDKKSNVKSLTERDGLKSVYDYEPIKGAGKNDLRVTVKILESGKVASTSKYEYYFKYKANGEEWTSRLLTELDGDKTDSYYNEKCGLPDSIIKGKEKTSFVYDAKCHVVQKQSPTELTKLEYDPSAGKVSYVAVYNLAKKGADGKPALLGWSRFKYDAKTNLTYAENSEKKKVALVYDLVGRIQSMVDQAQHRIDFEYNEASKPVKITDPKLGSIIVEYTNSGDIKKVDSSAGKQVAGQVTAAFQNLLEIVRPAGVTLAF